MWLISAILVDNRLGNADLRVNKRIYSMKAGMKLHTVFLLNALIGKEFVSYSFSIIVLEKSEDCFIQYP